MSYRTSLNIVKILPLLAELFPCFDLESDFLAFINTFLGLNIPDLAIALHDRLLLALNRLYPCRRPGGRGSKCDSDCFSGFMMLNYVWT